MSAAFFFAAILRSFKQSVFLFSLIALCCTSVYAQFWSGIAPSIELSRLVGDYTPRVENSRSTDFRYPNSDLVLSAKQMSVVQGMELGKGIGLELELGWSGRQEYQSTVNLDPALPSLVTINGKDTVVITHFFTKHQSFSKLHGALSLKYQVMDELRLLVGFSIEELQSGTFRNYADNSFICPSEIIGCVGVTYAADIYDWSSRRSYSTLLGAEYDVMLNSSTKLSPFIRYERGLRALSSESIYYQEALRVGLCLSVVY